MLMQSKANQKNKRKNWMKKKVLSFIELVQKENYILYQAEEARKY